MLFLLIFGICVYKLSGQKNMIPERATVDRMFNSSGNGNDSADFNFITNQNFASSGIQAYGYRSAHRKYTDDEKVFNKIHDFIHPKLFNKINSDIQLRNTRNITLNEIALKQKGNNFLETIGNANTDNWNAASNQEMAELKHGNGDFLINPYSYDTHTASPSSMSPSSTSNLVENGNHQYDLVHVINPLLVMGLLTFVAFLLSSILGLVDRLQLTNGLTPAIYSRQNERNDGRTVNYKLLMDFENILQMAIHLYERKF